MTIIERGMKRWWFLRAKVTDGTRDGQHVARLYPETVPDAPRRAVTSIGDLLILPHARNFQVEGQIDFIACKDLHFVVLSITTTPSNIKSVRKLQTNPCASIDEGIVAVMELSADAKTRSASPSAGGDPAPPETSKPTSWSITRRPVLKVSWR